VSAPDPMHEAWAQGYARWMRVGVAIGIAAIVTSFVVYLAGWLPVAIPPAKLPQVWGLPVRQYLAVTGAPSGWQWLHRLGQGDVLNFAGVALLASVTIACYARSVFALAKARDRALAVIALLQLIVLLVAASGWLER
jgi:hypothetical protein